MQATTLPHSYEEIIENPELCEELENKGQLDQDQQIAVIEDDAGMPVIYQPKEDPYTLPDWEEGSAVSQIIGPTRQDTKQNLQEFEPETYVF